MGRDVKARTDCSLKPQEVKPDPFNMDNSPYGIDPEALNECARWYWRARSIDDNPVPNAKMQGRRIRRVQKHPEDASLLHPAECGLYWPKDKGRPRQRALRQLVLDLYVLYPRCLRQYTMNPNTGSIPEGPLIDYLQSCMKTIGVESIPDSDALRERVQSAQEIVSALIM